MRLTYTLVQVAIALDAGRWRSHYGYELVKASGVRSGTLYPILTRMMKEGWLTDDWEPRDENPGGRPPRRYYLVTTTGQEALRELLSRARDDARFDSLFLSA